MYALPNNHESNPCRSQAKLLSGQNGFLGQPGGRICACTDDEQLQTVHKQLFLLIQELLNIACAWLCSMAYEEFFDDRSWVRGKQELASQNWRCRGVLGLLSSYAVDQQCQPNSISTTQFYTSAVSIPSTLLHHSLTIIIGPQPDSATQGHLQFVVVDFNLDLVSRGFESAHRP